MGISPTLLAFTLSATAALATSKPNILLIVSDNQGQPCLSCIGTEPMPTPNLHRLPVDGVRAKDLHVAASTSATARDG